MTTPPQLARQLRLLATLLVVSAVLFVIGISAERMAEAGEAHTENEPVVTTEATETPAEGNEGNEEGEGEETHAEGEASEGVEGTGTPSEEGSEAILGLNLENPWIMVAFAAASLALAIAVLRLGQPALLAAVLVAGAATLLGLREIVIQIQRANWLIAGLAGLVALAHAAATLVAVLAWRTLKTGPAATARAQA